MSHLDIEGLLVHMVESGASDLILTAGAPPQLRIHGLLRPVGDEPLDATATKSLAYSLLSMKQIDELERKKSLDLSKGFEGLSRFRINVFHQRDAIAMAIRMIPFDIPSFEELGLPHLQGLAPRTMSPPAAPPECRVPAPPRPLRGAPHLGWFVPRQATHPSATAAGVAAALLPLAL